MENLFLKVFEVREETAVVPLETAVCLASLHSLGRPTSIRVSLVVHDYDEDARACICVKTGELQFSVVDQECLPLMASFCQLPVVTCDDGISCVAGLCAVLRQVVKSAGNEWRYLLGFREVCLIATAEFSMWTKFCEVDLIACTRRVMSSESEEEEPRLPEELARLEVHLGQPIRVHQIGKLKSTEHTFVEGPAFLLSDIIIAIPVHIMISKLNCANSHDLLPLTMKWLNMVKLEYGLRESLQVVDVHQNTTSCKMYSFPNVSNHSLYKSDPKRYKPRDKIFIQQCDIDDGLNKLSSVPMKKYEDPVGHDIVLDLDSIPKPDVPQDRVQRKIEQLTNLTKAVLQISQSRDTIVDFCSGSGHLGLILAHCLPQCTVLLLDNKEKSLNRAREKLNSLQLKNVYIIQSNLDYFTANFQVGVSLHACGVASDLVIQKCLKNKANFVVCPCCYGNIQVNHVVEYPQSEEVRGTGLSGRGLVVLGHCADQEGTVQGERGMLAVDTDRCLAAQAKGYTVTLAKLVPPSCTPRNNLIVARLPR